MISIGKNRTADVPSVAELFSADFIRITDIAPSRAIQGMSVTPAVPLSRRTSEIDVYLESPLESGTASEWEGEIDTPFRKTNIKIRTHIVGDLSGSRSPSYLAARRRERCTKILNSVLQLERKADKPDFHIWTHETLSLVRRLIHFLDEAEEFAEVEHEGNTCEILRQVRDSFLRDGWERYREKAVRDAVAKILKRLASEETISAELADLSMDTFLDIGLEPVVTDPFPDEPKGEEADH